MCQVSRTWPIRKQLLVPLSIVSVAAIAIILITAISNTVALGNSAKDTASDSLTNEVNTNLLLTTGTSAGSIATQFIGQQTGALGTVAQHAKEIWLRGSAYTAVATYDNQTLPPGAAFNSRAQVVASEQASTYAVDGTSGNTVARDRNIAYSAFLDRSLKGIWQNNEDIVALEVGLVEGVLRVFPGRLLTSFTGSVSARLGFAENQNAGGRVLVDDMRNDTIAEHGWVIQMSQGIWDVNNVFLGAVNIDVSVRNIQNRLSAFRFYQTGYAFMVQLREGVPPNQRVAVVISHPLWDSSAHPIGQPVPMIDQIEPGFPKSLLFGTSTTSARSGVMTYDKNGVSYVASITTILNDRYAVVAVAPASEALASVSNVQDKVSTTQSQVINITVGVSIGAIVFMLIMVFFISSWLASPLEELVRVFNAVSKTSTEENRDYGQHANEVKASSSAHELQSLTNAFKNMINALHNKELRKKIDPKYPRNRFYTSNKAWQTPLLSPAEQGGTSGIPGMGLGGGIPGMSGGMIMMGPGMGSSSSNSGVSSEIKFPGPSINLLENKQDNGHGHSSNQGGGPVFHLEGSNNASAPPFNARAPSLEMTTTSNNTPEEA